MQSESRAKSAYEVGVSKSALTRLSPRKRQRSRQPLRRSQMRKRSVQSVAALAGQPRDPLYGSRANAGFPEERDSRERKLGMETLRLRASSATHSRRCRQVERSTR